MLLTKQYLVEYLNSMRIFIPDALKEELLADYGVPAEYKSHTQEYTEQDIHEQLRKRL